MEPATQQSGPEKATLEFALRPHAVPLETVLERHRPLVEVVQRLLGVVPNAYGLFEIWPPGFVTYNLIVPSFLDVPRCDAGFGLAPAHRAMAMYVSSRTHGCSYCAAHCAAVGTVFKGARANLDKAAQSLDPETCKMLTPGEKALVDYATAAATIPSTLTARHRVELARHFSTDDQESIVLCVTLMGFLNRAMDAFNTVLEAPLVAMSREHLAASGWSPGQFFVEGVDDVVSRGLDHPEPGFFGLVRSVIQAELFGKRALSGVGSSVAAMDRQIVEAQGFVPAALTRLRRKGPRRVLTHTLVERMAVPGVAIPSWMKWTMGYVAAKRAHNDLLAGEMAACALRAGAPLETLAIAPDGDLSALEPMEQVTLRFARATSAAPNGLQPADIEDVMGMHEPASIVELVVTMSIAGAFQRYTATYPNHDWDPVVRETIGSHLSRLGLPETPAAPDGEDWDAAVKAVS